MFWNSKDITTVMGANRRGTPAVLEKN